MPKMFESLVEVKGLRSEGGLRFDPSKSGVEPYAVRPLYDNQQLRGYDPDPRTSVDWKE